MKVRKLLVFVALFALVFALVAADGGIVHRARLVAPVVDAVAGDDTDCPGGCPVNPTPIVTATRSVVGCGDIDIVGKNCEGVDW